MDTSTKLVLGWYIIFMFLPMFCLAVVFMYEHIRHGIHSAVTVVFLGGTTIFVGLFIPILYQMLTDTVNQRGMLVYAVALIVFLVVIHTRVRG